MTDALAAAAEPTRRRILQLLARGPQYAGQIAGHFDVTRSAVSQHLGVLAEAGLVVGERQGRQRLYRIDPSGIARLQAEISSFWTAELDELVRDAHHLSRREHHPSTATEETP
ncbi:ArsR/SmtB family transcription factor [Nocardioides cynanchi]|uniref:ArsR/SmtB family transcription factor n=1 Tax=Nocardioides cynanchi TaxID=2558918 RepID=UPI001247ACF8|nr:metalloregulator ArsR/SmtB family transcription factor [Nocardioides cynanchi]